MTDRKPEIGDWVLYIPRPGQVRANQSKLAALVVMVNMDGSLELEVHPWNSEHVWQSRVPQESERHASHCWRLKEIQWPPFPVRDIESIRADDAAANVSRETSTVRIANAGRTQWTPEELAAAERSGKPPIVRNAPKKAAPAG